MGNTERCSGYQWLPMATTPWLGNNRNLTFTVPLWVFRGLKKLPHLTLRWVIMWELKFERTENHHFTIAIQMSQQVEFFHSLILFKGDNVGKTQNQMNRAKCTSCQSNITPGNFSRTLAVQWPEKYQIFSFSLSYILCVTINRAPSLAHLLLLLACLAK